MADLIAAWEDAKSREGEASASPKQRLIYHGWTSGTNSDSVIMEQYVLGIVPDTWNYIVIGGGFNPTTQMSIVSCKATAVGGSADFQIWSTEVRYTTTTAQPRKTGESMLTFKTTGATRKQFFDVLGAANQVAIGNGTNAAPACNGLIGLTEDGNLDGVEVTIPSFAFSTTLYVAPTNITSTWIQNLYLLTGCVNFGASNRMIVDGITLDFSNGELLYKGVSGSKRGLGDLEVTLEWEASPNVPSAVMTNITCGTIVVTNKAGFDYLWCRYQKTVDTNAASISSQVLGAYIDRIYRQGDLTGLNTGGNTFIW